jgi:putative tryptophan/tyrosine transport system substrate-binding protein
VDAILMLSSAVIGANQEYLAGLTLGLRLRAVTIFPDFARRGGLMAYGINPVNLFRQSAPIIAKVLRGSKPSEVPAELPTKFELVVNLKTAKRLGIVFPTSILLQADEVIE